MTTYRPERVAELIHGEIARILREEISDPRVIGVTITDVRLSPDLKLARVSLVPLGGDGDGRALLKGLKSACGFIRTRLGQNLKLRFTPELEFRLDGSLDEAVRVTRLLSSLSSAPEPGDKGDESGEEGQET